MSTTGADIPWRIESIKALPGHRLHVVFVDGLEGIVGLRMDDLTGVLKPLREERYFGLVELVGGVPTWPGGEELAPDGLRADVRTS